jgi:hypothetical protein
MVTRSFGFKGTRLHLNVRAALQQWGAGPCEVRVEILSANHEPLNGFGRDDADPITASGHTSVVSWRGKTDLSALAGSAIKLRFRFRNAKLHAFWFE